MRKKLELNLRIEDAREIIKEMCRIQQEKRKEFNKKFGLGEKLMPIEEVESMDVEERLDFLTRDKNGGLEECPHCGRFLSAGHQSVCDRG